MMIEPCYCPGCTQERATGGTVVSLAPCGAKIEPPPVLARSRGASDLLYAFALLVVFVVLIAASYGDFAAWVAGRPPVTFGGDA